MDKNQEKDFLLLRNLKDAGCNAEQIEKFLQLRQTGKTSGQLRLLSEQRNLLLENLHESQQKIDSLDHLLYSMKTNLSGRKRTIRKHSHWRRQCCPPSTFRHRQKGQQS